MKVRLINIFFLVVTLFFFSCSVNEKLDQNLAEMRAMNKNMSEMNSNMAQGIKEFNNMSGSIKTLSDEAVSFLKKSDPQQFFDMFNTISDRFEEMLAGLMDDAGDIKGFVQKANEVTDVFLSYSKALTPEDLTHIKDALDKISGVTEQINGLVAKTGNYEAMANQAFLTMQMFAGLGLSLGRGLDVIDEKNADAMVTLMDANMKNLDMLSSSGQMMAQMQEIQKNIISDSKNSQIAKIMTGFLEEVLPAMKNVKKMWTSEKSLNQNWDEFMVKWQTMDTKYQDTFCFALAYVDGMTQSSPNLAINNPLKSNDDHDKIAKMKDDLHRIFVEKCPKYKNVAVDI